MKALLIGTDFLKDVDGGFKMIETNTNCGLSVDPNKYIDKTLFENFILNGGFDELHLIYHQSNTHIFTYPNELEPDITSPDGYVFVNTFDTYVRDFCDNNGVTYIGHKVDTGAITIPYIEDTSNKLIIRISYDTTALIDDTYTKDNWEFLKLMHDHDPNLIAKTYIDDTILGFDSIGNTLRDNGNHPNYCVKKRITPSDNNIYPKLYKITTIGELTNLKASLLIDEYIQEYVYDSTEILNNKHKHYRSVDMLYGSNLDTMNLWVTEETNILDMVITPDYDDNGMVQIWDRPRYTSKSNRNTSDIARKFSADAGTKIIKTDDTIIDVDSISVGDQVKSIDIPDLSSNYAGQLYDWTGSTVSIKNNFIISATTLNEKTSYPYFGDIIEVETQIGIVFSDVPHAQIFRSEVMSGTSVTKLVGYELLNIGDTILIYDKVQNEIIEDQIIDIKYSMENTIAYSLNFESLDLFLTLEETANSSRYGIITHNFDYDCQYYACSSGYVNGGCGAPACFECLSGFVVPCCSYVSSCCRVDYMYPGPILYQDLSVNSWCTWTQPPPTYCSNNAFRHLAGTQCNSQKYPPAST